MTTPNSTDRAFYSQSRIRTRWQQRDRAAGPASSAYCALAVSALTVLVAPLAQAVDANWIGGDGSYATASNWDTDPDLPLNGALT